MLKLIERLRPDGETAAALATAIERTAAARAEAEAALADLQSRRGAVLMQGGATAERHEISLREARDTLERLAALGDALREKHATAEMRETRQRLEALATEVARAARAAGEGIARHYPKLAGQLAALLEGERAAMAAIDALTQQLARAPIEAAGGIALPPRPVDFYRTKALTDAGRVTPLVPLAGLVQLPQHDGDDLGHSNAGGHWPKPAG